MKISKRVLIVMAVFAGAALLRVFMAARTGAGSRAVLVLLIPDLAVLAAMGLCILLPMRKFERVLRGMVGGEKGADEMSRGGVRTAYEEELGALIDQSVSSAMRLSRAEIYDKQTELTALQSQINPHFLYNTLESIRGQALLDGNPEIARMVEALSSFFRYSISRNQSNLVTLREELSNIENYMLIQRYRFNNRFSLEVLIDEEDEAAYDYLIPRLIIQPVIENAIYHGLENMKSGGRITIEVILTGRTMILMISDNGRGMSSAELQKLNGRIRAPGTQLMDGGGEEEPGRHRNTGIALPNIHKRIQLLFGSEYGVTVYSTEGMGTDVEITVPADFKRSENSSRYEEGTA